MVTWSGNSGIHDVYNTRIAEMYVATAINAAVDTLPLVKT